MMPRWRVLLREPLLHCLLLAGAIYAAQALWGGEETDDDTIVVDREVVLRQMQYRARSFNASAAEASYAQLTAEQRQQLVDEFVEDEALHREALRLGLAGNDEVVRQRLIQKMGYLLEDESRPAAAPTDAQLQAHLQAHSDLYTEPSTVTFTHVYFDAGERGDAAARAAAEQAVAQLQARAAGFNDAQALGDRFAYLTHYVERTTDYVASQMGQDFAARLDSLALQRWQGPLRSGEGWHAVLITRRQGAREPPFEALRGRLVEDWQAEQVAAARALAVQRVVSNYDVDLRLP